MSKRHWLKLLTVGGLLAILAFVLIASQAVPCAASVNSAVMNRKIIHYVRERFGIPDSTKLIVAPFRDSQFSDFYMTTISAEQGKKHKAQSALITKDGHYMVIGDVFEASPTVQHNLAARAAVTDNKIIEFVRTKFHVPAAVKLTIGPFHDSQYADFYRAVIVGVDGGRKSSTPTYITKDGRYTVIGSIFNLNVDPREEVLHTINLDDQPSVGPANAPVTIVEYADLECPMCAETQKFIETQLLPKYGNRVRIVFKEFPLVTIHEWALQAAIANECVYQLDPSDFFHYRSIVFASQGMINAANVRTLLLDFGQRIGVNRLSLAKCLDSRATLPRVEADMQEGQKLGIMSTPTLFINGVPVVGLSPNRIYEMINKDLRLAR